MRKVSACIVNYNDESTILKTLETLFACTKGVELSVTVSDNGSTDHSLERIEECFPQVRVIRNGKNLGFGAGNNVVLKELDSDYHVLVNPDIELSYDVLTEMADYMDAHPDVGILTPTVMNLDGSVQYLPKRIPRFKYLLGGRVSCLQRYRDEFTMANEDIREPVPIDFCTGCFMFLRTSVFQRVGGLDERYFLYFEDADLTREVQKYAKTIYHPDMVVYHKWHRESGKNLRYLLIHISSMFKYYWKWKGKK